MTGQTNDNSADEDDGTECIRGRAVEMRDEMAGVMGSIDWWGLETQQEKIQSLFESALALGDSAVEAAKKVYIKRGVELVKAKVKAAREEVVKRANEKMRKRRGEEEEKFETLRAMLAEATKKVEEVKRERETSLGRSTRS